MDFLAVLKTKFDPLFIKSCTVEGCNFIPTSPQHLLTHFRSKHQKNTNIKSVCLHSKVCPDKTIFKTYSALERHLRKWHINFFKTNENYVTDNSIENENAVAYSDTTSLGNQIDLTLENITPISGMRQIKLYCCNPLLTQ